MSLIAIELVTTLSLLTVYTGKGYMCIYLRMSVSILTTTEIQNLRVGRSNLLVVQLGN